MNPDFIERILFHYVLPGGAVIVSLVSATAAIITGKIYSPIRLFTTWVYKQKTPFDFWFEVILQYCFALYILVLLFLPWLTPWLEKSGLIGYMNFAWVKTLRK
jgi:hypothetical protein